MFSVWTLSSLILSYTLGFPIPHNTSGSQMETFPVVTVQNSTEHSTPTNRSEGWIPKGVSKLRRMFMCPLSTCSVWTLGSLLQTGNEIAGDYTNDPMGIGKK